MHPHHLPLPPSPSTPEALGFPMSFAVPTKAAAVLMLAVRLLSLLSTLDLARTWGAVVSSRRLAVVALPCTWASPSPVKQPWSLAFHTTPPTTSPTTPRTSRTTTPPTMRTTTTPTTPTTPTPTTPTTTTLRRRRTLMVVAVLALLVLLVVVLLVVLLVVVLVVVLLLVVLLLVVLLVVLLLVLLVVLLLVVLVVLVALLVAAVDAQWPIPVRWPLQD